MLQHGTKSPGTPCGARRYAYAVGIAAWLASGFTCAWGGELRIGGAGPLIGTMELLAEAYNKAHPEDRVQVVPRNKEDRAVSMGTRNGILYGIKGVYEGVPFIGFSSQLLNDEQRRSGGQDAEVARVALFFAVAETTAMVDNLTTQQIVDIYSRKMREWRPGVPIRLVLRPVSESDNVILMDFMPQLKPLITELLDPRSAAGKGLPVKNDAQENASYIEQNPDALGLTSTNMLITEKRAIKPLKLDGVEPSPANVESGRYRLYKRVVLITGKVVTPEMRNFIDFVKSPAGGELLTRTGHVVAGGRAGR